MLAWPTLSFAAPPLTAVELTTVGVDVVAFTWVTGTPGTTEVELGSQAGVYDRHFDIADVSDRFHYATIPGLTPGTRYFYRVGSSDDQGTTWSVPSINNPGEFTTLDPPPGDRLFRFATINDTHVGETTAGLIVVGGVVLTPGFTIDDLEMPDPGQPYWRFTNEEAVRAINATEGVEFVIIKGDLSSEQTTEQFQDAKAIFDQFSRPYHVLRGNHDRKGENAGDPFLEVFGLDRAYYGFDRDGYHFVMLDTVDPPTGLGVLPADELAWLRADLAAHPRVPTLLFAHHPVAPAAPDFWRVATADARAFVDVIEDFREVLGVFSGHTHGNGVFTDDATGTLKYVYTAATKEYPGSYAVYDVYPTGYVQTQWKLRCTLCREWDFITRQEYFGFAPILQMGEVAQRNFVHRYPDVDADGAPDAVDNCLTDPNPDQRDGDLDGTGDICDPTPFPPRRSRRSGGCATSDGPGGGLAWIAPLVFVCALIGVRRRTIR
ncbi:MAG: metallophosphoesterase family protein [Myxococcales bacterium]|nr:metallophosphoesterase family protein [Myxococcales bacterium]